MLFEKMTLDEIAAHLEDEAAQRRSGRQRKRPCAARLLLEKAGSAGCARRRDARLHKMLAAEQVYWEQGIDHVAGVDEAGRVRWPGRWSRRRWSCLRHAHYRPE